MMRIMKSLTYEGYAIAVIGLLLLLFLLTGCSNVQAARETLATAAHAVRVVDVAESHAYRIAADWCLADSDSMDEYQACITPHNRIEQSLTAVQGSLLAVESSLDAAEAGGDGDAFGAFSCVANAIDELIDSLVRAGVSLPSVLADCVAVLRAVSPGFCPHHE